MKNADFFLQLPGMSGNGPANPFIGEGFVFNSFYRVGKILPVTIFSTFVIPFCKKIPGFGKLLIRNY